MYPANFDYLAPRSLDQALTMLKDHGDDAKLLAGGQSLIPAMKLRLAQPSWLIDLSQVPDLRGIRIDGGSLVIGALTLHADVASSPLVREHLMGLAEAASVIGDVQVRNCGTIGGSAAHADPAADFPVMLLALHASFVLASTSGTRTVAADDFFVDFFTTSLDQGEVLTEVRIPLPAAGSGTAYAKLSHPASGYVVVSAGVVISRDAAGRCSEARVAIGGLAGRPLRASTCESTLRDQTLTPETIAAAASKAAEGFDPEGDLYASADYKRHMATVYARKAIELAASRAAR